MSHKPHTHTHWTQEEDDLLAHWFPLGGVDAVMRVVHGKTVEAVRSRARRRNICLSPETLRRKRQQSAYLGRTKLAEQIVARKPFDDVPPEFEKVPSIWRVGQRYAAQEVVCES